MKFPATFLFLCNTVEPNDEHWWPSMATIPFNNDLNRKIESQKQKK
jgi:hypothetical protein